MLFVVCHRGDRHISQQSHSSVVEHCTYEVTVMQGSRVQPSVGLTFFWDLVFICIVEISRSDLPTPSYLQRHTTG